MTKIKKKVFFFKVFNLANNLDEDESMKKISELKAEAKEASKNRNRVFEYKILFIQLDFFYSLILLK